MLSENDGNFDLLIEDDGKGFCVDAAPNEDQCHFGLSVMRERAERISGELSIESSTDEGTRVRLIFPLETEAV